MPLIASHGRFDHDIRTQLFQGSRFGFVQDIHAFFHQLVREIARVDTVFTPASHAIRHTQVREFAQCLINFVGQLYCGKEGRVFREGYIVGNILCVPI